MNSSRLYSFEDFQRAVTYITNYAEIHGLVLPGRIPGFKRADVKLLPSSDTKLKVYQAYTSAMLESG